MDIRLWQRADLLDAGWFCAVRIDAQQQYELCSFWPAQCSASLYNSGLDYRRPGYQRSPGQEFRESGLEAFSHTRLRDAPQQWGQSKQRSRHTEEAVLPQAPPVERELRLGCHSEHP